ncbi:1-acylglycerol-3-phosphate O-acyltransferase [Phlyctochytrium planicorne]|nr:1-acylglycerol-3-phosphate O-acyltransferase [Phlyctochytrium planicorne]
MNHGTIPSAAASMASSTLRSRVLKEGGLVDQNLTASRKSAKQEKVAKGDNGKESKDDIAKKIAPPLQVQRTLMDTPLFILRQILFGQALMASCLYGSVMSAAFLVLNQRERANAHIAWAMSLLGAPACGVKVRMEGKENLMGKRPAVFVCGFMFPPDTVIMAKSDLKFVPFIGPYLWAANNVFINRNNTRSALDTMKAVANELEKKKMGLFMFPEGTRSHQTTNDMLPFKKGAFQLAVQGQMPIVPIVVSTYGDMYSSKQVYFRGGEMRIKVLPPIPTEGLKIEDLDGLVEKTRTMMVETLREISRPVAKL